MPNFIFLVVYSGTYVLELTSFNVIVCKSDHTIVDPKGKVQTESGDCDTNFKIIILSIA